MKRGILLMSLALAVAAAPVFALGPVDGEAIVFWWDSDLKDDATGVSTKDSAGDLGIQAELWAFEKWGVKGGIYRSNTDRYDGRFDNIDVLYKLISPTEKTYFAVGAGLKRAELIGESTQGLHITALGHLGFAGIVYVYGQIGLTPELKRFGGLDDPDGKDLEIGVGVEPLPFLSLRAAYHFERVDTGRGNLPLPKGDVQFEDKGFLVGAGIHW